MAQKAFPDAPTQEFVLGDHTFDVKIITKKNRLLCPIEKCYKRYEAEWPLTQHLLQKHKISGKETHTCLFCSETFQYRPGQNHIGKFCSKECVKKAHYSDDHADVF